MTEPLKLTVLISGGGRTLVNLHECIARGELPATIHTVVSSRGDVKGIDRARAIGIEPHIVERAALSAKHFQEGITRAVEGADLVCMAGFLSLWNIPPALAGRVINIHPALLPKFGGPGMYGMRVHEAVLKAGETESGCTVHFCDDEYDNGPIILQKRVPVHPGDTPDALAARVFEAECLAYPEAIRRIAADEVKA